MKRRALPIGGYLDHHQCHIDLQRLAGYARAGCLAMEAVVPDPEQGRLTLRDGSGGEYDILSIDIGSTSPAFGIPGVPNQVIPA